MTEARRLLAVLLVLVLGVGVTACGSDSDSEGDKGSEIEGVTWQVMNVFSNGAASSLPADLDPPTLELSDGKANVFAGCNSGSGEAEVSEKTIDFGPIGLTMKSCGQIEDQVEAIVSKVLQGEVKYEVNADGNLVLEKGADGLVLTPPK